MTIKIRDMSHYDTVESLAGYAGATHKVTEGTSFVDGQFARRLNAWKQAGVPVLGSYHVLHTGNLDAQLNFWLGTLDALTPWWRTHPHFIMQIDAEKWPNDPVSAAPAGVFRRNYLTDRLATITSTTKTFAAMLNSRVTHTWNVTYASRGQYGDSLSGISTELWNAHYTGNPDSAADWAPYSGRVPVLLQYTSTPFDQNAYRGDLQQLLAHFPGGDMSDPIADDKIKNFINPRLGALTLMSPKILEGVQTGGTVPVVNFLLGLKADLAGITAAVQALHSGDPLTPAQLQTVIDETKAAAHADLVAALEAAQEAVK